MKRKLKKKNHRKEKSSGTKDKNKKKQPNKGIKDNLEQGKKSIKKKQKMNDIDIILHKRRKSKKGLDNYKFSKREIHH